MSLTGKEVTEIARLLDQSRFSDLKLEIGDFRLRIRRESRGGDWADDGDSSVAPPAHETPVSAPQLSHRATAARQANEVDVPAPLLGTFYRAPRPGDSPFIEVGQQVNADTVIGIIEVMKLMNAVPAGVSGTVTAILVDNAQAIEAGHPLIRVAV